MDDDCRWFLENSVSSILERPGASLETAVVTPSPGASRTGHVLLLTGWNETFLRYVHVVRALVSAGLCVYTYDHRSQGQSSRPLADRTVTYVESWEEYVEDVLAFVHEVIPPEARADLGLLAHSMGGNVGALAALREPALFSRVALSAPMFAFKSAICPWALAVDHGVNRVVTELVCSLGLGAILATPPDTPGGRHQAARDISTEEFWSKLKARRPDVAVSVCAFGWVRGALASWRTELRPRLCELAPPLLLLQAEHDYFVHNEVGTVRACESLCVLSASL